MPFPLVLPASAVSCFKFYRDSAVHEGILYNKKIYQLYSTFDIGMQDSFECAKLLAQKSPVVLTTGSCQHRIWVALG